METSAAQNSAKKIIWFQRRHAGLVRPEVYTYKGILCEKTMPAGKRARAADASKIADSRGKILSHQSAENGNLQVKKSASRIEAEERSHEFFLTKTWKI